jgi:endoglucanase Acf2
LDILDGHVQADGSFLLDSTGITDVATNIGFDANRLNINELMNNFGKNTVSTAEKKKLELPKKVGVKLNLKAKEVIYHDLSLKNFRSAINVNDSRIRIENFHSELPFGTIDMQVTINDFFK